MYLRLVHLRVKPGKRRELREYYERRVMVALAAAEGCLHAALLEGCDRTDGWLSATFWRSYEHAEAFEQSPVRAEMLEESRDLIEHPQAWTIELSPRLGVEYESAMRALAVEGYSIEDAGGRVDPRSGPQAYTYVRIVSVKADAARIDEFKRRWDTVIVPALAEVKGCRFTFLAEGIRDRHHMLSVSIWDSQQEALKYEISGKFQELTRKLQDTLAHDHEWKAALGRSGPAELEPEVRGYEIVVGGRVR